MLLGTCIGRASPQTPGHKTKIGRRAVQSERAHTETTKKEAARATPFPLVIFRVADQSL